MNVIRHCAEKTECIRYLQFKSAHALEKYLTRSQNVPRPATSGHFCDLVKIFFTESNIT